MEGGETLQVYRGNRSLTLFYLYANFFAFVAE
jgi:hypothetical protein